MSRYSGPQHKGAARDHRRKAREEAETRNKAHRDAVQTWVETVKTQQRAVEALIARRTWSPGAVIPR